MKILLIGHEPRAMSLLEERCRAILGRRLTHLATVDSISAATACLEKMAFSVVLLDPDLVQGDALESPLLRGRSAIRTIIVSANAELVLPAFERGVLDFVPKPVSQERLAMALRRVGEQEQSAEPPERFLAVRRTGRIDLVPLDDLLYVEGADKYSELVLTNGQRSFYDKCLGRLEAALPPTFVRIHKSYLVRFPMVSRLVVKRGSRYFAELRNGLRLPVGRSRYERIKSRLI
ncbi:MAG TPA: LytTR family DNA-binding domain-containing protein [Opitutaceae bacterium]|nr:LytTR family DNA-binding domain-containing protein [Opitutaceae bacterium]